MLLAACGGGATATAPPLPTAEPAPTVAPTSAPSVAPTVAPTDTPAPPPTEIPPLADVVPAGAEEFAACMEERLGLDVARALVSGASKETAQEEAVLGECLLATASGVASDAIPASLAACLEERLGIGTVGVVGSGARQLTAEEEAVLVDCLVASALASS